MAKEAWQRMRVSQLQALHDDIERLEKEKTKIKDVLRDLFALIEDGSLVRNTTKDSEPAWPIKAMKLVMVLKRATDILTPPTKETADGLGRDPVQG